MFIELILLVLIGYGVYFLMSLFQSTEGLKPAGGSSWKTILVHYVFPLLSKNMRISKESLPVHECRSRHTGPHPTGFLETFFFTGSNSNGLACYVKLDFRSNTADAHICVETSAEQRVDHVFLKDDESSDDKTVITVKNVALEHVQNNEYAIKFPEGELHFVPKTAEFDERRDIDSKWLSKTYSEKTWTGESLRSMLRDERPFRVEQGGLLYGHVEDKAGNRIDVNVSCIRGHSWGVMDPPFLRKFTRFAISFSDRPLPIHGRKFTHASLYLSRDGQFDHYVVGWIGNQYHTVPLVESTGLNDIPDDPSKSFELRIRPQDGPVFRIKVSQAEVAKRTTHDGAFAITLSQAKFVIGKIEASGVIERGSWV